MIHPILSRRDLLAKTGTLSAAGLALLAGTGVSAFGRAAKAADAPKDADTLNVVLGLEHQAIGAYQVGADSGLLRQPSLNIALLFQSHHKGHRDALITAIEKLGGAPVPALTTGEYAKSLNASALKGPNDVLNLALGLELGAANAYIGIFPALGDRELAKLSGRILADEAMHWTALQSTLAQPLPAQPLMFGA